MGRDHCVSGLRVNREMHRPPGPQEFSRKFSGRGCPQGTPLVALTVKNLPAMQETWVGSLGQEDVLEEGMATHSGVLAWRILWTEEPGRLQSTGLQRVGHD